MWGACKGKGKGKDSYGKDSWGGKDAYSMGPYGCGGGYGGDDGGYGKDPYGKGKDPYGFDPYAFGGKGKDSYGGYGGGCKGMDKGDFKGMMGKMAMKGALGGFGMDAWGGGGKDGGWDLGPTKKKRGGGAGGGETKDIEGFKEAVTEALAAAGVTSETTHDVEEVTRKIESVAYKQAAKFQADERSAGKMQAAQARAYVGEFVEANMTAFANFLYEKDWFEKVSWNGVLLMLVLHTFQNGKIFTRTLKTEILPFVDDGLLSWSEEERIVRTMWTALESAGVLDSHKKKANTHLMKAFDQAHFESPFGSSVSDNPEVAQVQDFVKGWMSAFLSKAFHILEGGLQDSSKGGQVIAMTTLFQTLMDPNSPCLPLSLQPALPAAPWSFIEECATQAIAEAENWKVH